MNSNGDVQDLAIKIGRLLSESKKSIATAESCTGGWVGKEFTAVPGSSKWYGFGYITYSNTDSYTHLTLPTIYSV